MEIKTNSAKFDTSKSNISSVKSNNIKNNISSTQNTFKKNGVFDTIQEYTVEVLDDISEVFDEFIEISKKDKERLKNNNYTNTEFTAYDNIFITEISKVMVDLKNNLGEENYEIYSKYIEGLKLKEVVSAENGKLCNVEVERIAEILKELNIDKDPEEVAAEINKKINESGIDLFGINSGSNSLSSEIMNSKITEVVDSDSGYDAIVYEKKNGEYMIINSCTNPKSAEDIATLAYSLSRQLTGGDELYNYIVSTLEKHPAFSYILSGLSNDFDLGEIEEAKKYYEGQTEDAIELLRKYNNKAKEEGKTLNYFGYSLGGGIALTAYSKLYLEDPTIKDNITTTVYNPWIGHCEQNSSNKNNELINILDDSDNVVIYAAEADIVSQFNTSVDILADNTVYIPTTEIGKESVNSIGDLFSIIIGNSSNHGFQHLKLEETFDQEGNLIVEGHQISIESVLDGSTGTTDDYTYNDFPIDANYSNIIKRVLNLDDLDSQELVDELLGDSKFKDAAVLLIDDLKDYLEEYAGKYEGTYDDLIDKIVDDDMYEELSAILGDSFFADVVTTIIDRDTFQKAFRDVLKEEKSKEIIYSMIEHFIANNQTAVVKDIASLITGVVDKIVDNKVEQVEDWFSEIKEDVEDWIGG